jgi:DUF1365 family protein
VTPGSALYVGRVVHRRVADFRHRLNYRTWMLLLDLDRVDADRPRLLGHARFAPISWRPEDHGDGSAVPLRRQIEGHLAEAGVDLAGGPIQLLTMPRVLGYGFNPISVYFCFGPQGDVRALVHEVTNTFGVRHSYVLPARAGPDGRVRQTTPKTHHVSPFMDAALTYDFTVLPPGERVSISIDVRRGGSPLLTAGFTGDRRDLTSAALARVFLTHALLTWKVTAAIHWEAFRMLFKGARYRHPPAPNRRATTVPSERDLQEVTVGHAPSLRRRPREIRADLVV